MISRSRPPTFRSKRRRSSRSSRFKKTYYFYADGGGILIFGRSYPTIEAVEVYENFSSVCAGGVSVQQISADFCEPVRFKDCVFRDNRAAVSGAGVDLLTPSSWAEFENCLFVGNLSNHGINPNDGLGYAALTVFPKCRAIVKACTFVGNRNAVDDRGTGSVYTRSIFWRNNRSGGATRPERYELIVHSAAGVTGCSIGGSEVDDPISKISRSANTFACPDPEFGPDFRPRNPLFKGVGYRPRPETR